MNPIIYQIDGNLIDGLYLPGEYQWTQPVTLARAEIQITDLPRSGTLTLTLEIGGVQTPVRFTVTPAGAVLPSLPLGILVPANTLVLWKAAYTGSVADAADGVAIMVYPAAATGASPPPSMVVKYVNGPASWVVLNYNNTTKGFAEAFPGALAAAGIMVAIGAAFNLSWNGVTVLLVANGQLQVKDLDVEGPSSSVQPQLQFLINGVLAGTLTQKRFHLADATEGPVQALSAAEFEFYSGAPPALTAVLWSKGLLAASIVEGL